MCPSKYHMGPNVIYSCPYDKGLHAGGKGSVKHFVCGGARYNHSGEGMGRRCFICWDIKNHRRRGIERKTIWLDDPTKEQLLIMWKQVWKYNEIRVYWDEPKIILLGNPGIGKSNKLYQTRLFS